MSVSVVARVYALLVAIALVLAAARARADPPEPPTAPPDAGAVDRARALFRAGNAAAEVGAFADALELYVRAYELSGNAAALYNVARTLRSLGRFVEARDAFDALLALDSISEATRTEAGAMRAEVAGRVARWQLGGLPEPSAALLVRLDGRLLEEDGRRPLVLELDPGRHGVSIVDADGAEAELEAVLAAGAATTSVVRLGRPGGRELWAEPALWAGAALLVVAVAVLGGVIAWDAEQLRPGSDRVLRL